MRRRRSGSAVRRTSTWRAGRRASGGARTAGRGTRRAPSVSTRSGVGGVSVLRVLGGCREGSHAGGAGGPEAGVGHVVGAAGPEAGRAGGGFAGGVAPVGDASDRSGREASAAQVADGVDAEGGRVMAAECDLLGLPPARWTDGVSGLEPRARFWSSVDELPNGCWRWLGSTDRGGYGSFQVAGETFMAHRAAWFLTFGRWPTQTLDHLCRARNCVNPDHLENVSMRENSLRSDGPTAINARKTHCRAGHEFTPENTYDNGQGNRKCRECALVTSRVHREKKRAESFTAA